MYNKERNDSIVEMFRRGGDAVRVFDLLIERYSERLYWHIRRIVVQHEEAEDILQDTFVAAYTSFDKFRGDNEASLTAWLYRIATNLSIRALRRRRSSVFVSVDSLRNVLSADFENEIAPDGDEIAVKLQRAVVALPMKQKLVFNMRYYDEMPFEAISQVTGQSVSTLKTNYHYAVKRIKEQVTQIEL